MAFDYTPELLHHALTYAAYRQGIDEALAQPPADEAAAKLRPYTANNVAIMQRYDATVPDAALCAALEAAPPATWLVLSEGWCGDAAFNVPVLAALERAVPGRIALRIVLRDSHLDLMDAHLTDGGRSIPKLIVLSQDRQVLGTWGPRPAALQQLMRQWKEAGFQLKELIPKVQAWYDADGTRAVQQELAALVRAYS